MAQPSRRRDAGEQRLIERYIDLDTDRYPSGRADARLRDSGVSVRASVAFLDVYSNDIDKVAEHFGLSLEEVEAALAHYRRNRPYVDARIVLNEAESRLDELETGKVIGIPAEQVFAEVHSTIRRDARN